MSDKPTTERSQLFLYKNAFNPSVKFTHVCKQLCCLFVFLDILREEIFFIVNAGFTTVYYSKVLEVEDGDVKWELFQEGFLPSFAAFLIKTDIIDFKDKMDSLKRKFVNEQQQQTLTGISINEKSIQNNEKKLKANDNNTDFAEFKRDVDSLNSQLKEKIEKLRKLSLEMVIIETRMKNYLNSGTLAEIKAINQSLQETKIHNVFVKENVVRDN
ncbi:hypothetical protein PPL_04032 [Heterostelium album PN500]|uniref:Uncharacterized protein n=1 Tax=Heterostelium pallidum (strain ATCC 26659 / Pp 5 / PN500) TaxID=670386 RepID=D3B5U4_HETP5|nr:hypothetical protein PPL_04032 [Heterostelium album PN500]EFA83242.1 hypothetical protein PPL_04032 [Heterostelium album PN500]|eukprot:XP_020435359.1 hypothetical protein PPL_04032 [Heterostelium album PN500]